VPPAILERYRVASHDANDEARLSYLGDTSRGTPIWINRDYLEAQVRVVVGAIEPHQFVGFSGASRARVGLGGYATIVRNHSMMTHRGADRRYDDNPCRQDIEEIGARIGVHLALNVVLGEGKRVIRALAGRPLEVMRRDSAGPQPEPGAGRAPLRLDDRVAWRPPKDINLYQAQKALAHAALVARPAHHPAGRRVS